MNQYIKSICIILFASNAFGIGHQQGMSVLIKPPTYTQDIEVLFTQTLGNAYKINAQAYAINSDILLRNAAEHYYIPSATITGEIQDKFDRPAHPDPYSRLKLDLSAKMKLWSNATGDKLSSAESKLVASKHKFNEIAIEIYTALNANLMKIEYAREYLAKAQQYRQRMDALLDKMNIASKFGIMKRSDRLFADVSIKKFDESVLNVQSQIEQYVSLINTFTPKKLYRPDYGLSKNYLHNALSMSGEMFSINNILQRNFSILNRRADLTAAKYDTLGYNENAVLELVTQHGIEEHRLTSTKNAENQAVYGYSYDDDGSAYIGLKFTYTGLNFQSNQNKRSEYNLYSKKVIEFDAFLHDLFVKLKTQKQQYELVSKRIESIEKQIHLTTDVISSLLKEMAVDEANAMDLFRNISSLSDLEMNRLSTLNELIDLVTNIKSINAVIPKHYVIH